ncbi:hypothetical protein FGB62_49g00 [Gracilaria domingensis]|nr:hypothetical protein FGB62_49g00 [Gracilaria domingensis]
MGAKPSKPAPTRRGATKRAHNLASLRAVQGDQHSNAAQPAVQLSHCVALCATYRDAAHGCNVNGHVRRGGARAVHARTPYGRLSADGLHAEGGERLRRAASLSGAPVTGRLSVV